jgi:hypothetical protein
MAARGSHSRPLTVVTVVVVSCYAALDDGSESFIMWRTVTTPTTNRCGVSTPYPLGGYAVWPNGAAEVGRVGKPVALSQVLGRIASRPIDRQPGVPANGRSATASAATSD